MEEKYFPICGTGKSIPWSIAEKAYEGYVKKYGRVQTLERIAERGGFYPEEMDSLAPEWREHVEEIYLLRAEFEKLKNPKWISVKDRLPDNLSEVIVRVWWGQIRQVVRDVGYSGGWRQRNCQGWECLAHDPNSVTHWVDYCFADPVK